ncbi:hypothetical protein C5O69_04120 [Streptococcus pseudopneumoniae]|uniref:DUF1542 domain-containing protein n=2 Tax=Streptococcus TaxID=1301 RepID=A0A3A4NFL5_9STRE|nr:hypothetical protein C5O69_04120 [Streptococcus pseudopneumoniae]
MSEVEKDKKEVQPELEEETVSIGRRSKSPQSQDRSVEKQNEGSATSSTSYINGEGSYSLSDDIHKLLQRLKNSDENQEQVQKLNEAYEKFNAALGTSETGLVDQEIFNTALEEYRKASQLQQGEAANLDGNLRHSRETSSLKVGVAKGRRDSPTLSNEKIIPSDGHPVGNNIRFLAESSSAKEIRRITVKAYDPQANSGRGGFTVDAVKNKLGLTTSGLQGSGSKKWVDLAGHIPDNRFGINNIIVEAEDASGYIQTTTVGVARPLPKASFTTKNEALNGKANKEGDDRPVVSGKIPYPVETNNIPSDAELKAYLVTGGRVDDSRYIPGASDYTIIAVTRVKVDGTFDFVPPEYTSNTVGTKALKLVVKYTKKGTNDTYYEGLESLFSADSRRATVNLAAIKQAAKGELATAADAETKAINADKSLTTAKRNEKLQEVATKKTEGERAIDAPTADDADKVAAAKNDALNKINNVHTAGDLNSVKQAAKGELATAAGTETPTSPSEPVPQPSQPTASSQPASPAPAPSSAPTQAPRAAASPSASSTSTQAPAQEQVDKSELRALTQELDQRLKALATVSDPKIDAAKVVLLDAQKALEDSALTEQGLRTAVESVKAALDSLKDVKANASDSKPAQDKKDAKQGTEDSKDSDKMTETNSVPAGVIVVGLLALLGVIAFWLVRRKKESEIQQLITELTRVLGQLDAEKADKKVLAKAQNLLQETLDFVKEENGSAETEAKLVEELKAILDKLK